MNMRRRTLQVVAVALAATLLTSCTSWHGIANVPLPGGPGTRPRSYTVYVQMPDTLALNANSRVRVADVFVGRVRAINLKNWIATLTLDLDKGVKLPKNATAKIGQTSLLGSQHVELAAPANPSPQLLKEGDTIPLQNASAYPTTERVLASVAAVLRGGGIPNVEVIANEVNNILTGRADQIHDFLEKLDTFTARLNEQRDDLTRAIDSTDRLLTYVANRSDILDRALTEFSRLAKHFADQRDLFANAINALGRFSDVLDQTLTAARPNLDQDVRWLQRPLKQLSRASVDLVETLKIALTIPFSADAIPKVVHGDSMNVSITLDLTLSSVDNALLTGTGFSGALRALEQSWGRNPNSMLPDVRFNPNPVDVPAERDED
ncbi:mammalian cell entry protein [Mycobacterium sp. MFM001]|nr:mammalian cell entry protein [Mycobacterium sp. MFM001]